ncbi:serine-rich adhesin for platelets-like [Salvelinus alpinus]|uniref:serine-rich adhesin for platelets-like n=1 Tax=Salvelinus alpinus TaxID=8036 RepID=UPI0039FCF5F9
MRPTYNSLHDPNLNEYYHQKEMHEKLKKRNFITKEDNVVCSLKEYNTYKHYLDTVKTDHHKTYSKKLKEQILRMVQLQEEGHIPKDVTLEDMIEYLLNKGAQNLKHLQSTIGSRDRGQKYGLQTALYDQEREFKEDWVSKERSRLKLIEKDVRHDLNKAKYMKEAKEKHIRKKMCIMEQKQAIQLRIMEEELKNLQEFERLREASIKPNKLLEEIFEKPASAQPALNPAHSKTVKKTVSLSGKSKEKPAMLQRRPSLAPLQRRPCLDGLAPLKGFQEPVFRIFKAIKGQSIPDRAQLKSVILDHLGSKLVRKQLAESIRDEVKLTIPGTTPAAQRALSARIAYDVLKCVSRAANPSNEPACRLRGGNTIKPNAQADDPEPEGWMANGEDINTYVTTLITDVLEEVQEQVIVMIREDSPTQFRVVSAKASQTAIDVVSNVLEDIRHLLNEENIEELALDCDAEEGTSGITNIQPPILTALKKADTENRRDSCSKLEGVACDLISTAYDSILFELAFPELQGERDEKAPSLTLEILPSKPVISSLSNSHSYGMVFSSDTSEVAENNSKTSSSETSAAASTSSQETTVMASVPCYCTTSRADMEGMLSEATGEHPAKSMASAKVELIADDLVEDAIDMCSEMILDDQPLALLHDDPEEGTSNVVFPGPIQSSLSGFDERHTKSQVLAVKIEDHEVKPILIQDTALISPGEKNTDEKRVIRVSYVFNSSPRRKAHQATRSTSFPNLYVTLVDGVLDQISTEPFKETLAQSVRNEVRHSVSLPQFGSVNLKSEDCSEKEMIEDMLKSVSTKRSKDQACQLTGKASETMNANVDAISLTPKLQSTAKDQIIKVLEQVNTKIINMIRQDSPNRTISRKASQTAIKAVSNILGAMGTSLKASNTPFVPNVAGLQPDLDDVASYSTEAFEGYPGIWMSSLKIKYIASGLMDTVCDDLLDEDGFLRRSAGAISSQEDLDLQKVVTSKPASPVNCMPVKGCLSMSYLDALKNTEDIENATHLSRSIDSLSVIGVPTSTSKEVSYGTELKLTQLQKDVSASSSLYAMSNCRSSLEFPSSRSDIPIDKEAQRISSTDEEDSLSKSLLTSSKSVFNVSGLVPTPPEGKPKVRLPRRPVLRLRKVPEEPPKKMHIYTVCRDAFHFPTETMRSTSPSSFEGEFSTPESRRPRAVDSSDKESIFNIDSSKRLVAEIMLSVREDVVEAKQSEMAAHLAALSPDNETLCTLAQSGTPRADS